MAERALRKNFKAQERLAMPKQKSQLVFAETFLHFGITRVWRCRSKSGVDLGIVKWWAHWRRYCFFPDENMLFDPACLCEIAAFCQTQTTLQKNDQKRRREKERIKTLKATPVSDPEKFIRCSCGAEIPKDGCGICDECIPF